MNQQLLEAQAALRGLANEQGLNVEAGQQAAEVLAFANTIKVDDEGHWGIREGITYSRDVLVGIFRSTQALLERGLVTAELASLVTMVIMVLGVIVLANPDTAHAQTATFGPATPGSQPAVTGTPFPFDLQPDGTNIAQGFTVTPPAEVGNGSGANGVGGSQERFTNPGADAITEYPAESGKFSIQDAEVVRAIRVEEADAPMRFGGIEVRAFLIVKYNGRSGEQMVAVPAGFALPDGRGFIQGNGDALRAIPATGMRARVEANFPAGRKVNIRFGSSTAADLLNMDLLGDGIPGTYSRAAMLEFSDTESLDDAPFAGTISGYPILYAEVIDLVPGQ